MSTPLAQHVAADPDLAGLLADHYGAAGAMPQSRVQFAPVFAAFAHQLRAAVSARADDQQAASEHLDAALAEVPTSALLILRDTWSHASHALQRALAAELRAALDRRTVGRADGDPRRVGVTPSGMPPILRIDSAAGDLFERRLRADPSGRPAESATSVVRPLRARGLARPPGAPLSARLPRSQSPGDLS